MAIIVLATSEKGGVMRQFRQRYACHEAFSFFNVNSNRLSSLQPKHRQTIQLIFPGFNLLYHLYSTGDDCDTPPQILS
jgi:hypothetical protein